MGLEFDLKGKPWYIGAAIGLFIGVAIVVALQMMVFKNMQKDIRSLQNKLQDRQKKLSEAQAAQRELPKFREEVAKLEKQLEQLVQILPSSKETHNIIKKIKSLADQGDFDLKSFIPKNIQSKGFYAEWPIDVNVEGTYHNLALFFDKLRTFPRIVNIASMNIRSVSNQTVNTINATFSMVTYIYMEEKESSADKPAKGKKGGKK
ncbi:MAG TPA: type 4a pilus biogenesis protein PilO [Thermoanaerobaculia bacterium]|nr:type 4a pilus biogenesis protein PilO [Thermoanaerobaculia bacterium]HUM30470.1 type 4a pilus biogenesis protein PilO [Thermoanaerobaculia bacterium]HXK68663.1 type 4a pilus biogenesis protein PilO [Thermoanaerobaculia bacterium]